MRFQGTCLEKAKGWKICGKFQSVLQHTKVHRASHARDGRKWKERHAAKMRNLIYDAAKTKVGPPTVQDVIETAVNLKGGVVPYFAAYRAVCEYCTQASTPPPAVTAKKDGCRPKVKRMPLGMDIHEESERDATCSTIY